QRHADGDLALATREMGRCDAAREALAALRCGIGDDIGSPDEAQRLQRQELRITGADANAPHIDLLGQGFTVAHCVTGINARHPSRDPTGSARATEIRLRLPPNSECQRVRLASPSTVTALATKRPPEGSIPSSTPPAPASAGHRR